MPKTSAPQSVAVDTILNDPVPVVSVTIEPADPAEDFRRGDDPTTAEEAATAVTTATTDAAAPVEVAAAPTREYRTLVAVNYGPSGEEQRYEIGQPIRLTDEEAAQLLAMRAIERVLPPAD